MEHLWGCSYKLVFVVISVWIGVCTPDFAFSDEKMKIKVSEESTANAEGSTNRGLETIILNAEYLNIQGDNGNLEFSMEFNSDSLEVEFQTRSEASYGQVYSLYLKRKISFRILYQEESLKIDDIRGISLNLKLPIVSDLLRLRKVDFNLSKDELAVYASGLGGWVELIAKANIRTREFDGVDWYLPFLNAVPRFFKTAKIRLKDAPP